MRDVMRIALVNAPLKIRRLRYGVGHQMPLGLLMVGGPCVAAAPSRSSTRPRDHLSEAEIARRVAAFGPTS